MKSCSKRRTCSFSGRHWPCWPRCRWPVVSRRRRRSSSLREDVKFDFKHFTDIERLAMVGDKA